MKFDPEIFSAKLFKGMVCIEIDLEGAEWMVDHLPKTDEITKAIAKIVVAGALDPYPASVSL